MVEGTKTSRTLQRHVISIMRAIPDRIQSFGLLTPWLAGSYGSLETRGCIDFAPIRCQDLWRVGKEKRTLTGKCRTLLESRKPSIPARKWSFGRTLPTRALWCRRTSFHRLRLWQRIRRSGSSSRQPVLTLIKKKRPTDDRFRCGWAAGIDWGLEARRTDLPERMTARIGTPTAMMATGMRTPSQDFSSRVRWPLSLPNPPFSSLTG